MPISEDEFNQYSNDSNPSTTMSKAELRKTHKPIMEKRRRAKINNCLNEIKDLILVALKKDPERHSKLEKADILEMAVKHLKNMQRQQRELAVRTDPSVAMKYKSGFIECAGEVSNYVNQLEGLDAGLKQRLTAHLSKCANSIEHKPQLPFSDAFAPSSSLLASFAQSRYPKISGDDQNNNARIHGIELIPSCLPNGEFAFLVPKSSFSSILSSQMGEERPSAFVTVTPSSKMQEGLLRMSKPLSPPMSPTSTDDFQRNPSPRGFQPIVPKNSETKITSTTTSKVFQPEIQHIRFPIHNVKKENVSEPLCIITNSTERYRQAQVLEDTYNTEENIYHGMKRRFREEPHHGLLTVAEPPKKIYKIDPDLPSSSSSSTGHGRSNRKDNERKPDEPREENNRNNEPMWRPW